MKTSIKCLPHSENAKDCLISKEIYEALMLFEDTTYELHLGHLSEIISISKIEDADFSFYIPETIYKKLIPFDGLKLNLWRSNKDLYLGPVIGIFQTQLIIAKLDKEYRFLEIQHIKASLYEGCLCYYFSSENIDWDKKIINGVTFFPDTLKWASYWFPMPDVVYDLGVYRSKKLKPLGKQTRSKLRDYPNIKFINNKDMLEKWELHEKLSKYPLMKNYLPETEIYKNINQVQIMLDKYTLIFLKSFSGSKGREVVSIEQIGTSMKINYYDPADKKLKDKLIISLDELEAFISKFFGNHPFIVQQGIHLMKFDDRYFDLRVLINKNEKGFWECTFMQCRIAQKDLKITNVAAGGTPLIYDKAYPMLCRTAGISKVPTYDEIFDASAKIAENIQYDFGPFGEIGIDMAIDTSGNLWLIEANTKPTKDIYEFFLDLFGERFVNSIIRSNKLHNMNYMPSYYGTDLIYPQALPPFRYAKFLCNCT